MSEGVCVQAREYKGGRVVALPPRIHAPGGSGCVLETYDQPTPTKQTIPMPEAQQSCLSLLFSSETSRFLMPINTRMRGYLSFYTPFSRAFSEFWCLPQVGAVRKRIPHINRGSYQRFHEPSCLRPRQTKRFAHRNHVRGARKPPCRASGVEGVTSCQERRWRAWPRGTVGRTREHWSEMT